MLQTKYDKSSVQARKLVLSHSLTYSHTGLLTWAQASGLLIAKPNNKNQRRKWRSPTEPTSLKQHDVGIESNNKKTPK